LLNALIPRKLAYTAQADLQAMTQQIPTKDWHLKYQLGMDSCQLRCNDAHALSDACMQRGGYGYWLHQYWRVYTVDSLSSRAATPVTVLRRIKQVSSLKDTYIPS
jgi:hypothetical protein